jgi:hypothetical protein
MIICDNLDYLYYLYTISRISAINNLATYYGSLAHDHFPDDPSLGTILLRVVPHEVVSRLRVHESMRPSDVYCARTRTSLRHISSSQHNFDSTNAWYAFWWVACRHGENWS